MSAVTIQQMADRVAALMEQRLGVRGRSLPEKLRRGRRRLPRRLRREAALLADATAQAGHPRLMAQLDHERLSTAYDALVRHLSPLGRSERRTAMLRSIGAGAALAVLAVLCLFFGVAAWRGLI